MVRSLLEVGTAVRGLNVCGSEVADDIVNSGSCTNCDPRVVLGDYPQFWNGVDIEAHADWSGGVDCQGCLAQRQA